MIKLIEQCPSCNSKLIWNDTNVDLFCINLNCPAQIERKILHFFQSIQNIDGVGPSTVKILVKNGYDSIPKIYAMTYKDFENCGYKHKTIINLGTELEQSKERPIPDYVFIGALGIKGLGRGSAKKLLENKHWTKIVNLTYHD